jgi:hypothetical protein
MGIESKQKFNIVIQDMVKTSHVIIRKTNKEGTGGKLINSVNTRDIKRIDKVSDDLLTNTSQCAIRENPEASIQSNYLKKTKFRFVNSDNEFGSIVIVFVVCVLCGLRLALATFFHSHVFTNTHTRAHTHTH